MDKRLLMMLTEAALHIPGSFIEKEEVRIGKIAVITCAGCMKAQEEATCYELSARDIYVYCSKEFEQEKRQFLCTALKCPSWLRCAEEGVCRECVVIGAYKRGRKLRR
ncbi:MAG: hypothetical protein H7844_14180 [Nitrospirae bacterium YQR-1]